jgi:hypothetical protein
MSDKLPDMEPVMLSGLTWRQALSALNTVDCAVARPHWCNVPGVVLADGKLTLDADGELSPYTHGPGDRAADDWMMIPRVDDDGNAVTPTYRALPHLPSSSSETSGKDVGGGR